MSKIKSKVDFVDFAKKYMNPVKVVKVVALKIKHMNPVKVVKVVATKIRERTSTLKTVRKWKGEASKSATLVKLASTMRNDSQKAHRLMSKLNKITKTNGVRGFIEMATNKLERAATNKIQDLATLKVGNIRGTLITKTVGFLQKASKLKALAPVIKVFKPVVKFVAKYGSRKLGAMGLGVSGAFIAVDAASGNTRSAVVGAASTAAATVGGIYGVAASLAIDEGNARWDRIMRITEDARKGQVDIADITSLSTPWVGGLTSELYHAMGINKKITFDTKRARQAKETEAMPRKLQAQGKIDKNVTLQKYAKVNKHKDTNQPDKKVAQNTRKTKVNPALQARMSGNTRS